MDISCIRRSLVALVAGSLMCAGMLAAVTDLPVTTIGGVKCYYYEVQPRESIYQVGHKLGVTREQITEHNPSASDGLKPRMRLYFPVSAFSGDDASVREPVYAPAAGVSTHVVKKGETLYGIARQYGMSPDTLLGMNPHAGNGLKTGDVLHISDPAAQAETVETPALAAPETIPDSEGNRIYEIKGGETLFSIAKRYGVTLEDLLAANPKLDPLRYKPGEHVRIPSSGEDVDGNEAEATEEADAAGQAGDAGNFLAETDGSDAAASAVVGFMADSGEAGDAAEDAEDEEAEVMNVAVMLPFMLADETQSRTTQLYTEFFKGMLMAVDTLGQSVGVPVKFHFYDTAVSLDTVMAVLRHPEIAEMDMVVAPDNSAQLAAIVDAVDSETLVLNIFAVKDETYKTHRNMIQTNIPHDAMYARAIDGFMERYSGVLPVFISRNGGQADKDSFVRALKERLDAEGRDYREVVFGASLGDEDLAGIDPNESPVVFVPNSGSKTEFAKFVKALTSMRNERAADPSSVTVFGYPEWVTFRGESFDEICELGATIYSRFLVDETDADTAGLKKRYKEFYGVEMFEAVPTQGILGYDIGRFIIEGLREMAETGAFPQEFNGVQNSLRLGWSGAVDTDAFSGEMQSNGGLVNEALILINYNPGGNVESKVL